MTSGPRLVTVVLEVADLERAVALYRDAFGVVLHPADHGGAGHGAGDRAARRSAHRRLANQRWA
jgi:catechol 2,3-dioxygenase-like lactoylglutathione lyase family enzyme